MGARSEWGGTDRRFVAYAVAGALVLRLVLMWARGAYVSFDEGYYLLLGENLWSGRGFTLSGRTHVTFSPLYPVLAGAVGKLSGSPVWGGRLVSVVASALLLLPAYALFRRAGGRTIARPGVVLLAVVPSLITFVPFWSGRELYQGSEPLYHLLLFGGLALAVRAALDEGEGWRPLVVCAVGSGLAFGLAYLTRPEALAVAGAAAVAAGVVRGLRSRRIREALAVAGLAGVVTAGVAAPYVVHLHDVLGRWTLSGRAVRWTPPTAAGAPAGGEAGREVDAITRLVWRGDQVDYIYDNYTLDASARQIRSRYWGVPPEPATPGEPGWERLPPPEQAVRPPPDPEEYTLTRLYLRTLGIVLSPSLWPLVLLGLFLPRRGRRRRLAEGVGFVPVWAASVAVAVGIYVDPRNHLILAPTLAFYTAAGLVAIVGVLARRIRALRRGFLLRIATVGVTAVLLLTALRWAYLARVVGSPHHLVARENRAAGAAVRGWTDPEEPVMSWHPAIALYARRDWRVLPYEPFPQVVRYGAAREIDVMVLSAYYPSPLAMEEMPKGYMALYLPGDTTLRSRWRVEWEASAEHVLVGRLVPGTGEGAPDSTGVPALPGAPPGR